MGVYILHFEHKVGHSGHYVGFTTLTPELRLARHLKDGSALVQAAASLGKVYIARHFEDWGRAEERWLKDQKNTPKFCPICRGDHDEIRR